MDESHSQLHRAPFWRDKFVYFSQAKRKPDGNWESVVAVEDPETGHIDSDRNMSGPFPNQLVRVGDHLLVTSTRATYEAGDGLKKASIQVVDELPANGQPLPWIRWQGRPAYLGPADYQTVAFDGGLKNGAMKFVKRVAFPESINIRIWQEVDWKTGGSVRLPQGELKWLTDGNFNDRGPVFGARPVIQAFDQNDGPHLFLSTGEHLLYRKGLELTASGDADEMAGWSLVQESPAAGAAWGSGSMWTGFTHGMLVDGQPVALIVDDVASGQPIGRAYRFDGTSWSEFATEPFPVGSRAFRTAATEDGQRSYVVVTTATGMTHLYAVETGGFRKTSHPVTTSRVFRVLGMFILAGGALLLLGAAHGLFTSLMMAPKSEYGFGLRSVQLASLRRRGCARFVDLCMISVTTLGLGWFLTRHWDWPTLIEALNLRIPHPAVSAAARTTNYLLAWLFAVVVAMIASQAFWGITPGKWLCGLRTVQTSLRPCGIARSVVREFVALIECGGFICWAPGIVSIALTERRQRLGDRIADTIVINAASLN